jgi:hypothetical protein
MVQSIHRYLRTSPVTLQGICRVDGRCKDVPKGVELCEDTHSDTLR